MTSKQQWDELIAELESDTKPGHEHFNRLAPVATAMATDPMLGRLYPHMSHHVLGISKKQDYPFTPDMPFVEARLEGFKIWYHADSPPAWSDRSYSEHAPTVEFVISRVKDYLRSMGEDDGQKED
jgi:hypothetical protein